ncbi:hypothetical protein [Nocardia sp. CNY236]|nr:hypothetical protein [Nocardia sp. CNY236]
MRTAYIAVRQLVLRDRLTNEKPFRAEALAAMWAVLNRIEAQQWRRDND